MYQKKQQNQYNQYGQQSYFGKGVEIISRGRGINDNEYQAITSACIEVKDNGRIPLSGLCIKKIQEKIRGEWFAYVCPESETNFDFYLSFVDKGKYLTFKYAGNEFHICAIKV